VTQGEGGNPGVARLDARHIDTWLFDLDNTLYPLDSGIAERLSSRITDFTENLTGLPRAQALALQKKYLADHGLTLKGLMTHHGVLPDAYHEIFLDVPLDALSPDPALRAALERLPGRKLIFTNSDDRHTERVLRALNLTGVFEDVFHIGSSGFTPKPEPDAYARAIADLALRPSTTAFFEDAARNLEPAAALGMTTVLVGPHALDNSAAFVHYRAPALTPCLEGARLSETARP